MPPCGRLLDCAPRDTTDSAMTSPADRSEQPNSQKRYTVRLDELPMSCPLPSMEVWNSHPRVYLPLEAERECKCPYCGALFVLED